MTGGNGTGWRTFASRDPNLSEQQRQTLQDHRDREGRGPLINGVHCSFCGPERSELIRGHGGVTICPRCISRMYHALAQKALCNSAVHPWSCRTLIQAVSAERSRRRHPR